MQKNKTPDEFPFRGINQYLDKVYAKIDEYNKTVKGENKLSFTDLVKIIGHENYKIEKDADKRRFIRNMGFNEKVNEGEKKAEQLIPFGRTLIKNIYLGLHINPEEFLLDKPIEDIYLEKEIGTNNGQRKDNKDLFIREYWTLIQKFIPKKNTLLNVISFTNRADRLKRTYRKIAKEFSKSKRRILIQELTFKGKNHAPGNQKIYHKAHSRVLRAIEKALETHKDNPNFHYTRILSLSKSQKVFKKSSDKDDLKIALIGEASKETLDHIRYCKNKYPNRCSFYISQASRFRHHALIDNKWCYVEDYIYKTANEAFVPDSFYIDRLTPNTPLRRFIKAFESYIDEYEKTVEINKGDIEYCFPKAKESLNKRITTNKETIDLLEKILLKNPTFIHLKEILESERYNKKMYENILNEFDEKEKILIINPRM